MEEDEAIGHQTAATTTTKKRTTSVSATNKRLVFDRRYGWVIDEWKPAADEALSGGRGMFCILPLAKGLLQTASYSINLVTNSAVQILERRNELSLQHFQANVGNQLQHLGTCVSKPVVSVLTFKDKLFLPTNSSSDGLTDSSKFGEPETT